MDNSDRYFPGPIPLTIIKCVCIFLILFANGVVILAVLTSEPLRQVPDNLFICSLAATDFLIGALVVSPGTISTQTKYTCQFDTDAIEMSVLTHVSLVLMVASVWNLFIISFNRYHFIIHSLKYHKWMTNWKIALLCSGGWIISLFLHCLHIIPELYISHDSFPEIRKYNGVIIFISYGIPIMGITVLYMYIMCFTNKVIRRNSSSTGDVYCLKRFCNKRIAKLCTLLVAVYTFFGTRLVFILLWVVKDSQMCTFIEVSSWLAFGDSLINPFIYTMFNSHFREAILTVLNCKCCPRKNKLGSTQKTSSSEPSIFDTLEKSFVRPLPCIKIDKIIDLTSDLRYEVVDETEHDKLSMGSYVQEKTRFFGAHSQLSIQNLGERKPVKQSSESPSSISLRPTSSFNIWDILAFPFFHIPLPSWSKKSKTKTSE